MKKLPSVVLDFDTLGCEGCIYMAQRSSNPQMVISGEVPCFQCEAMLLHTGMRCYKVAFEPEPVQDPAEAIIRVPIAPPAQSM